jgi:hypothetical protein
MPRLVILPTDYPAVTGPLAFLAGPIQGATDWQAEAIRLLGEFAPQLHVASPRRDYPPGAVLERAQVDWETHHLRRAAEHGVILFWLARESVPAPGRDYAQTSRFELAEWKVRHERDGVKLVVGIEDGFSGARYIRYRFVQDYPRVPLVDSLEEVCRRAAGLAGGV